MYKAAQRAGARAERRPAPQSACRCVSPCVAPFTGALNACSVGSKGSVQQQTWFLPGKSRRHTNAEAIQYEEGTAVGCCDGDKGDSVIGQARERGRSDTCREKQQDGGTSVAEDLNVGKHLQCWRNQ